MLALLLFRGGGGNAVQKLDPDGGWWRHGGFDDEWKRKKPSEPVLQTLQRVWKQVYGEVESVPIETIRAAAEDKRFIAALNELRAAKAFEDREQEEVFIFFLLDR